MHDNMLFNYNKKHMVLVPKIVLCHTQAYKCFQYFPLATYLSQIKMFGMMSLLPGSLDVWQSFWQLTCKNLHKKQNGSSVDMHDLEFYM